MKKTLVSILTIASGIAAAVMVCLAVFAVSTAIPYPGHPAGIASVPLMLGMLVNQANIQALYINYRTIFNEAFAAAPTFWENVAMRSPSTTGIEDYKWLSEFPQMRKWVGDKQVKNLEGYDYVLKNEDFESTIAVNRNDIEDDKVGIYTPRIQGAGRAAKVWPDLLVFQLLTDGFTAKCFDGQPFFAAAHQFGKVTFCNKGTKKLSATSQAAAIASYGAARTALLSMTDDQGTPLGLAPNVLVVSPENADVANALMTVDRLDDGKANLYKGSAKVIVVPFLQGPAWFLMDTSMPIKPLIFQVRKDPEFIAHTDPNSDSVFNRKEFKFGAEARGNVGFGLPQMAYGSDGSVA